MAPAIWDDEGFSASGVKGITRMRATLDSIEDDVPGDYGMQMKLNYEDVEVLETETGELFEPEGGMLTIYQGQSTKKNSSNHHMQLGWSAFCRREKLDPPPSSLLKVPMIWERQEHEYGPDLSPAKFFVPVELDADAPAHSDPDESPVEPPAKIELNEATQVAIVATLNTENGSPLTTVRRAFTKFTAAVRKDIGTVKDLPAAMTYLVDLGVIELEDGLYKPAADLPW